MPYIKQCDRDRLTDGGSPTCAGELNYEITYLLRTYWKARKNYQAINDIAGALECAKLEFIRRIVNPYEDSKIESNGDVY